MLTILQVTPGAGGMFCGNCFRDNALVAQFRKMGHETLLVPLYLPMRLDEEDQTHGTPIFFSGINVYLDQKSLFFRKAPAWLRDVLASPGLLKWAAGKAAKTRAADVGDLTLSMLEGEHGNQARDLEEMLGWLKGRPHPDVICLSNALLVGMARKLKEVLRCPVVCSLQGEDAFLDALPDAFSKSCWQVLSERARDIDLFIAPSHYYGELMSRRAGIPKEKIKIVYNGINLEGYASAEAPHPNPLPGGEGTAKERSPEFGSSSINPHGSLDKASSSPPQEERAGERRPILGYFARMCREKGLHLLVESYIQLRQRNRIPGLKLRIGGGCGPADETFVKEQRDRIAKAGLTADVEFHPNVDRKAKLEFLRSLSVFCVPAIYGEAFGLYVIEALASGVPVVEPSIAAFPELIHETEGGILAKVAEPSALADAIETLLLDAQRREMHAQKGLQAVREKFSIERMAEQIIDIFSNLKMPS